MILSGALREKVIITNYATSTIDEWGDATDGTGTSVTVNAKVVPELGTQSTEADTRIYRQRAKFTFRYDANITLNNQTVLTWQSKKWEVIGTQDPTGLKAELHVLAETQQV